MITLNLVFLSARHAIISKIVEAKFGSSTIGDITVVHFPAFLRIHTILNTSYRKSKKTKEVAHPLRVSSSEIVVNGDKLAVTACKSIQVERTSRNERLSLPSGHFSNALFVQSDAPDELDIVVHHFPRQLMIADIVAFTTHTAGGVFYRSECFREKIVELLAIFLIALHEFSRFSPKLFVAK